MDNNMDNMNNMDNNINNDINNMGNQQPQNIPNQKYDQNQGYNQQPQYNQQMHNNQIPNNNQQMYNNQIPNYNQQQQNNNGQNPTFTVPDYTKTTYDKKNNDANSLGVKIIIGICILFGIFRLSSAINKEIESNKSKKESTTVVERTFTASQTESTTEATTEKAKVTTQEKKVEEKEKRSKDFKYSNEKNELYNFVFTIPRYFSKSDKSSDDNMIYTTNDVSDDAEMIIHINTYEQISKQEFNDNRKDYLNEIFESFSEENKVFDIKTCLISRINDIPAVISKFDVDENNEKGTGEIYLFLDEANKQICYLMLIQPDDSKYDYYDSFDKVAKTFEFNGTIIQPETTEATTETTTEGVSNKASGIRPEFKEMMDSYEAFYDEYISFMQKMNEDPTNMELLNGYYDLLSKELEWSKKMEALDESSMTDEEAAYYVEVTARVSQKLINAGISMSGD